MSEKKVDIFKKTFILEDLFIFLIQPKSKTNIVFLRNNLFKNKIVNKLPLAKVKTYLDKSLFYLQK